MSDATLSGRLDGTEHVFPVRVYYEDTDALGIVYHANYLRFVERARTEMMRLLGTEHSRILEETGVAFAVRRTEIDFKRPARLDDLLEVRSRIMDIRGASLDLEQTVRRATTDLVTISIKLVCINRIGQPVRLPKAVVAAMNKLFHRQQRD